MDTVFLSFCVPCFVSILLQLIFRFQFLCRCLWGGGTPQYTFRWSLWVRGAAVGSNIFKHRAVTDSAMVLMVKTIKSMVGPKQFIILFWLGRSCLLPQGQHARWLRKCLYVQNSCTLFVLAQNVCSSRCSRGTLVVCTLVGSVAENVISQKLTITTINKRVQ